MPDLTTVAGVQAEMQCEQERYEACKKKHQDEQGIMKNLLKLFKLREPTPEEEPAE